MKKKATRRKFIQGAMFSLGGIAPLHVDANEPKTKLLTSDGKLVEVSDAILAASTKSKASNKEIIQWSDQIKKTD